MVRLDMLRPYVEKVVGDYLGIAPGKLIVNDDGSIPITAGSADYTIRLVESDPNVLQVYSVVLQEVEKSPELFEALNAINRDLFFTRLFWLDDKRVIAGTEMIPESADKEEIANACKSISWAADKYDTELHGKFGGKMARADEPQPPTGRSRSMSEAPAPRTKEGLLEKLSGELADLVERVAPSIVALTGEGDDFEASGSGFFVDEAGHVVTNFHVVDGLAQPMEVGLHGGDRRKASLVGSDPLSDLALLKLADPPGPNLRLREDPPRLGELCVGLGSPFGMYPESVAFGVVSGLARTIEQDGRRPIEHAIQTDVAINPGNSGGPLVDVRGEVIGVNQSHDTRGTGIGFAVPAEIARWVIAELKDYGKIERASLGVSVVKRTVELDGKHFSGLAVVRDGAPDDAGLRGDDVIVQLAGQPIDDPGDLYRVLTRKLIDTPTPVQVIREGKLTDLTITPTRLADLS